MVRVHTFHLNAFICLTVLRGQSRSIRRKIRSGACSHETIVIVWIEEKVLIFRIKLTKVLSSFLLDRRVEKRLRRNDRTRRPLFLSPSLFETTPSPPKYLGHNNLLLCHLVVNIIVVLILFHSPKEMIELLSREPKEMILFLPRRRKEMILHLSRVSKEVILLY